MEKKYIRYSSLNKLPKKSKPGYEKKGAYLLGTIDKEKKFFYPRYVGSSFKDLIGEIRAAIKRTWEDGVQRNIEFVYVKKAIRETNKQAWEQECIWYHKLKKTNELTNKRHPKREKGKDWKCPDADCNENCD